MIPCCPWLTPCSWARAVRCRDHRPAAAVPVGSRLICASYQPLRIRWLTCMRAVPHKLILHMQAKITEQIRAAAATRHMWPSRPTLPYTAAFIPCSLLISLLARVQHQPLLCVQIDIMDKFTLDLKALTQTQIDITWCVGSLGPWGFL